MRISEGRGGASASPSDYGAVGARSVADEAARHWDYLLGAWKALRVRLPSENGGKPPSDSTGEAVARWLVPLFAELGYGRLTALRIPGVTIPDEPRSTLPITHRWQRALIHIVPWDTDLGRGLPGSPAAQSLLQEALNRCPDHLWGITTNGRHLRLLRDTSSLSSASYVEFDIAAIFDGELFNDFALLFAVLHASSFEVGTDRSPGSCRLEQWHIEAVDSAVQALDVLRDKVELAVTALGTGFLHHPANARLIADTSSGDLHNALLRLVFKMVFVFVIEDRGLLHDPAAGELARRRYDDYFSTTRLRASAMRGRQGVHSDLYQALSIVLDALGADHGRPELGLIGLGGLFTRGEEDRPLEGLQLSNEALLTAVRHLTRVRDVDTGRWRAVDFKHLGARELGSVYEALLEAVPEYDRDRHTLRLVPRAGNARKRTGSFYTPSSLVERLLDSALEPVLDDAVKQGETDATEWGLADPHETVADRLLSVTVCDPACGSGHFLVAAAQRIAKRVASVRERDPEPTEEAVREAMHEVVARCIYGVDLNPMAVALAKLSLWMEGMAPGRPLDLLDPHIKHGNALVGAAPAQLELGIPDTAFSPIEGDDRAVAAAMARRNANELAGQGELLDVEGGTASLANTEFAMELNEILAIRAGELRDVRRQEDVYLHWRSSERRRRAVHAADAWCAAFMWEKTATAPLPITHGVYTALRGVRSTAVPEDTHAEIVRLRDRHCFFHWHLEFPDVFRVPRDGTGVDRATGWDGGFDCVVTNPPWDKLDFEDKKYFSLADSSVGRLAGMARRERIMQWIEENPEEGERYRRARRMVKSGFHFAARSGSYPLCAQGLSLKGVTSLQLDQLFVERCTAITHRRGRLGVIVPSAIATGAGAQRLFRSLTERGAVASLYDFENLKRLFRGVHSSYKFCLLSLAGEERREAAADFAFYLHDSTDLGDRDRTFRLEAEEIGLINPNTGTLPMFRTRKDADLTLGIHRRMPVFVNESQPRGNPWAVRFVPTLFHMTDDSALFRTREELEEAGWRLKGNIFVLGEQRMLPLWEGKTAHHFDHRWNSFTGTGSGDIRHLVGEEKSDPHALAMPRYWVPEHDVAVGGVTRRGRPAVAKGVGSRLESIGWNRGWMYGWRDVCRATDERTAIPMLVPRAAVGHTFPLMLPDLPAALVAALYAVQSSLVFDYAARQKVSGAHMPLMTWKQLPVPSPEELEPHLSFVVPRVLELVYTAHDMAPFARDLGYEGPPFVWGDERRANLRGELDAFCFHLYGLGREDVENVLESFQTEHGGLKHNEIARHGTYRTRNLVLSAFEGGAHLR
ncbi:N-6 DNA methylase [Nocardiopsis sp. YSL2]|uniref:Eco57I restriction-modification methylase domain-containing protein n=1 Tax=Nocardiopsis sp. YSL2 TaxID=2939492 RepID=UPI0026F46EB4|nr:N-6 DNA methylase [Nocardiopsis sp. YSL2]